MGKRELVYVLLVHLFVHFACINFCPFYLPLGVRGWVQLVIMALPGRFCYFFFYYFKMKHHLRVQISKNLIGSLAWFLQIKLLTMLLLFDGFITLIP